MEVKIWTFKGSAGVTQYMALLCNWRHLDKMPGTYKCSLKRNGAQLCE